MEAWIWTLPALPLAGFLVLALAPSGLARRLAPAVGIGSVGLAAAVTGAMAVSFWSAPPADGAWGQVLHTWFAVGDLAPAIGFRFDALALVMCLVVSGVGFLIHVYSAEYMRLDESIARFFACMNLFVASMLVLVLADNLVLLYLGWEGVGLCSYLLIGFWWRDPANGRAARKAFVVTRIGDTALAIGLFMLFADLRTLDIQEVLRGAADVWVAGDPRATWVAALLLGGAIGKSAQLPLHTWLPDAMAGPTPVSALIHAATMVTAGVYLIARTHVLFALAPAVMAAVAAIGAGTLAMSGFSALAQTDIKRVLAWSTIGQIGYMFLALGVGAWSAAIFHLMTHAFFKALLFLAAGAVILALHHEQDLRKMGGLRRRLPLVYWTFLAGAAALAGFPLVTAGFYSKDLILHEALRGPFGNVWLYAVALGGALLTALYTFRLFFLVFHGPERTAPHARPGLAMAIPLVVLAALSLAGGFVDVPEALEPVFGGLQAGAVEAAGAALHPQEAGDEALLLVLPMLASLGGIAAAWFRFGRRQPAPDPTALPPLGEGLRRFWLHGWHFDRLYEFLIATPYAVTARLWAPDGFDAIYRGLSWAAVRAHVGLRATQDGRVRRYAAAVALGAAMCLAAALLR